MLRFAVFSCVIYQGLCVSEVHVLVSRRGIRTIVHLLSYYYYYAALLFLGCHEYDFINSDGTRVKGNGFRSLIVVLQKLLERVLENLQKCSRERGGVFYSISDHLSSLTAVTRALQVHIHVYYNY